MATRALLSLKQATVVSLIADLATQPSICLLDESQQEPSKGRPPTFLLTMLLAAFPDADIYNIGLWGQIGWVGVCWVGVFCVVNGCKTGKLYNWLGLTNLIL